METQPAKDGDRTVKQWNETRIAPSEYLIACQKQREMRDMYESQEVAANMEDYWKHIGWED